MNTVPTEVTMIPLGMTIERFLYIHCMKKEGFDEAFSGGLMP